MLCLKLSYPSIDKITNVLMKLGPGAMLFKIDIDVLMPPCLSDFFMILFSFKRVF